MTNPPITGEAESRAAWVLVPPEITLDMQHAYFDVIDANLRRVETDAAFGRFASQEQAYRAMLAAAPPAPIPTGGGEVRCDYCGDPDRMASTKHWNCPRCGTEWNAPAQPPGEVETGEPVAWRYRRVYEWGWGAWTTTNERPVSTEHLACESRDALQARVKALEGERDRLRHACQPFAKAWALGTRSFNWNGKSYAVASRTSLGLDDDGGLQVGDFERLVAALQAQGEKTP